MEYPKVYSKYTNEDMDKQFCELYETIRDQFTLVEVPKTLIDEIRNDFIPRYIIEKAGEDRHIEDGDNEVKRIYTGILGEASIETKYGVSIIDRDSDGKISVGPSYRFGADFNKAGLNMGIKTCDKPNFPVIWAGVRRPQMVNIKVSDSEVLVGGYATRKVQGKFQSSDFIKNFSLRNKRLRNGSIMKKAFYGFHKLVFVKSFEEIKALYYKKE